MFSVCKAKYQAIALSVITDLLQQYKQKQQAAKVKLSEAKIGFCLLTHRYSSRWNDHVVNVSVNYFQSSFSIKQAANYSIAASLRLEKKSNGIIKKCISFRGKTFQYLWIAGSCTQCYFQGNRSQRRSALHT